MRQLVWISGLLCILAAQPASAHHSFAMFDNATTEAVQGTVVEWQWTNPHSWIRLEVQGADKTTKIWYIEGLSPNVLSRQGWRATSLKPGDKVTVAIHPLKSRQIGGSLVKVTLADGKVLGQAAP